MPEPLELFFTELEYLLKQYHNSSKISVGNRQCLSKDGSRLKSLTLGVRGAPGLASKRKDKTLSPHLTKHTQTETGHEIYKLLYTIIGLAHPSFEFNSIIVNFNSNFVKHKDKKNVNINSVIFSVGTHTGGGLEIYNDDDELIKILNIKRKPTLFAGKTTTHATEPFEGQRWCIVAYQTKPKFHYCPFEKQLHAL
tara:strand:- start:50 stop:634 length:585 start_codon:yes stop_codon:yes gene_type:complete